MQVHAITPTTDTRPLLAGAQFGDAFTIEIAHTALDARRAAEKMLGRSPRWIKALLAARDRLVTPFGLKTSRSSEKPVTDTVGIFPVLNETPARIVAGFDDRHLDFRIVIDVATVGTGQRITATTLVLTHNRFGRVYLAIILPFHRLIVRSLLRQVAS